jgi:hypothetical protein
MKSLKQKELQKECPASVSTTQKEPTASAAARASKEAAAATASASTRSRTCKEMGKRGDKGGRDDVCAEMASFFSMSYSPLGWHPEAKDEVQYSSRSRSSSLTTGRRLQEEFEV